MPKNSESPNQPALTPSK